MNQEALTDLLERAADIISWFPRKACPDCNPPAEGRECRIESWIKDYKAAGFEWDELPITETLEPFTVELTPPAP